MACELPTHEHNDNIDDIVEVIDEDDQDDDELTLPGPDTVPVHHHGGVALPASHHLLQLSLHVRVLPHKLSAGPLHSQFTLEIIPF